MSATLPHHSTHASQVISYLKSGVTPIEISRALGITPGAVTQLMATPEVATELTRLREEQAIRSSAIDAKYDSIEEKLLNQLEKTIPLLMRPGEIAGVLTRINAAKRRGVAHAVQTGPAQVLQLNIPIALQSKFVVNGLNQVVEAGDQTLVTMQSGNIAGLARTALAPPLAHTITGSSDDDTTPAPQPIVAQEDEFGFTHER